MLPAGNENVFARALGFGADPAALARAIAGGGRRRIDLGRARTSEGTRRFVLMLSAGFDADVIHRVARWRTAGGAPRRVGRSHYAAPDRGGPVDVSASTGLGHRRRRERRRPLLRGVELPGVRAGALAGPGRARGRRLARLGRVRAARATGAGGLHVGGGPGASGALPHVRTGRARRLTLTSAVPVPVQLDGEPAGFTPVEIEALPSALAIVTA